MRDRYLTSALVLAVLIVPCNLFAIGEAKSENGDYTIEAIGSGRVTGAYLHYPDVEEFFPPDDDGLSAGVLRLILEGYLGEYLDYEVNIYGDLSLTIDDSVGGVFGL